MKNNDTVIDHLETAIGGEWKPTLPGAPVQGYTASFPRFRSDAIVGVVNDAAQRAGFMEQAVSFGSGSGLEPFVPRDVVIPRELAEDAGFQRHLTAEMKQVIAQVVSQHLSYAASQGMQR